MERKRTEKQKNLRSQDASSSDGRRGEGKKNDLTLEKLVPDPTSPIRHEVDLKVILFHPDQIPEKLSMLKVGGPPSSYLLFVTFSG